MTGPSPVRLVTAAFLALTLSDLAYFTATGVLLAVTPLFATGPLGAGEAGVGVAMGSFSVTTVVLRPWAGRWTDRHGRRLLLVGGALAVAAAIAAHHLVTSLVVLVAVRVVLGAAEALYVVAGFAVLADLAPPGRAGEALSLNSLALFVGLAIGPLVGQALLGWRGFDAAWAGAAVLAAVAAIAAARVPETRPPALGTGLGTGLSPRPLLHPAAVTPGVALFTGVAVTSGFLAFAVLQARQVGLEAWSVVLVVFGTTVVVLRLGCAALPDRVAPLRLAAAALGCAGAGLAVIGAAPTPPGLVVGTVVLGVATAFLTPAVFAAVFSAVPASERGGAAATTSIFIDLGLGGGPLLLGLVAAATSVPAAFLLVTTVPFAGSALLLVTGTRRPPRPAG